MTDALLDVMRDAATRCHTQPQCLVPNIPTQVRQLALRLLKRQMESCFSRTTQQSPSSATTTTAKDRSRYCTTVEQTLFLFVGDSLELYQRKVTQLAFNIGNNGVHLMQSCAPENLITMNDNFLATGTDVERKRQEYARKVEECRKSLDTNGLFKEFESASAMELCPKCKGSQLTYTAVQDRSADEGQTVYFNCLNAECKHKWRVRT